MGVFKPNENLTRFDPTQWELNPAQRAHLAGEFDVYALIPQDDGDPLPPLALQWKKDWARRLQNKEKFSG